ncbi:MAG: hypothetical protein FJZ07_02165 [Candidatus Nealsonbacteria bacterium]|nr:hypothetical protein [Candidatus Nealsonbacteria bacterium]
MSKIFILASVLLISSVLAVVATSKDDIVFPVAELGGCESETECKSYCDNPENMEVCISFAEKHNLISKSELEKAKKFIAIGKQGPGNCDSAASCEAYCNDITNIEECLAFAEQSGLMPPEELAEARKVKAALDAGAVLPGGCSTKDQCEVYCENPNNMEECLAFGEAAGLIPPEELAEAKKVLAAIKQGATPPPCRGKEQCETYCRQPENMEPCLTFAEAAGLIPPDELADAKRMLSAIRKGIKPLPCGGREECDVYCAEETHFEECLAFAEAAGFIAPEEAEMARKTGGKGPGGCKGRKECEAFCQDPTNQETCFNFAMEHGLMSEEDLRRMEEGKQQLLEAIESAPPEVRTCLENTLGSGVIEGIRAGTVMPREEMGDAMRECFESQRQIMEEQAKQQIAVCLAMSCQEFFTCIQSIGGPPGEEGAPPEGEGPEAELSPEIEAKIQSCVGEQIQQQMPPEGMMPEGIPEEFQEFMPPEREMTQPPSPEEIEAIRQQKEQEIREQIEQQMRQQMEQQMMEQQMPQPEEAPPESFFEQIKNLLAGLILLK